MAKELLPLSEDPDQLKGVAPKDSATTVVPKHEEPVVMPRNTQPTVRYVAVCLTIAPGLVAGNRAELKVACWTIFPLSNEHRLYIPAGKDLTAAEPRAEPAAEPSPSQSAAEPAPSQSAAEPTTKFTTAEPTTKFAAAEPTAAAENPKRKTAYGALLPIVIAANRGQGLRSSC